jgi:outer membrane protein assembly factor BamA
MCRTVYVLVLAVFATAAAAADDEVDPDRDFDLPGAEVADFVGDGGIGLEDADFVGSPLKRFAERWPEDLVVAPIPGRSPQMGWTLTLGGGYFLKSREEDSEVAPSLLGGFAMVAENGSYAYGGGANLHLLDDKLRVQAGAGYLDIRYAYYGSGSDNNLGIGIDILQEAPMYFASASWRVWGKLYVGLGYLGGDVDTRLRVTLPQSPFLDPSLKLDIGAYVIPIEFDSRDHEQFPREGWLINGRAMIYRDSAGSDFETETFKFSANYYRPMGEQNVLALRAYMRATNEGAPFFVLSTFGGSTDLRGYPSGRYRDRMMYALQAEYRWQFSDRWIFTGFAGFGEVAANIGDFGDNFLPAAGIGGRFVLSKKHRVGLSADIAVGKDGTEFYFGVGEAF